MDRNFTNQFFSTPLLQPKHYFLLFLVWPFMAFIAALANYSQKEAKKVVYFFLIYYGLTFVIIDESVDAARYALMLKATAALPFSDFFKIVGGIYSSDTSVDIVQPLITFIVSRFTDNYGILFAVYAALFGYFYLKSIDLLHNRYKEDQGWNSFIQMAFFTLILPITTINGFRMWTAAWIFFYGAYHVILNRDPRYFLITLGSCLVHFSFLSVNAILVIYYFAGNRNFIYFPLAVVSFVLPKLIAPYIQLLSFRLGGGLQSRVNMYTNEYYIASIHQQSEQVAWFIQIGNDLLFYYLLFAIIVIQIWRRYAMKEKAEKNLFSFILLFLAFVNFGKNIPSLGARFQIVFFLFATLYLFLYMLKMPGGKLNLLTIIGLFPMALFAAIAFRQGSESINAWIFTPGFGLPQLVPGLSIAELLFH
jgi:hypothetical protein